MSPKILSHFGPQRLRSHTGEIPSSFALIEGVFPSGRLASLSYRAEAGPCAGKGIYLGGLAKELRFLLSFLFVLFAF